jgi:hypothetical protein
MKVIVYQVLACQMMKCQMNILNQVKVDVVMVYHGTLNRAKVKWKDICKSKSVEVLMNNDCKIELKSEKELIGVSEKHLRIISNVSDDRFELRDAAESIAELQRLEQVYLYVYLSVLNQLNMMVKKCLECESCIKRESIKDNSFNCVSEVDLTDKFGFEQKWYDRGIIKVV